MALLVSLTAIPVSAADFGAQALFDNFDRTDEERDLAGSVNAEEKTVWWTNWDPGTAIEDNALVLTGEAHFGAGIDTGTDWQYLVMTVKGDAAGILVAPGGNAVALDALVGADGGALPALSADDYQEWVIDIDASGLTRDAGLHLNIGEGTLYVDSIYYASAAAPARDGAPAEKPAAEADEPAAEAVTFPDPALVDDFDRAADEADNGGGVNTQGLDTWWYNAYDYVIEDGALAVTFDADHDHFGMGANVPSEAGYQYLTLRVKGVDGGDYSGLMLNLGAKNPVMFADMLGPDGAPLPEIGTEFADVTIDIAASGIVFDQGFHINSGTEGTLYIDTIYYSAPSSAALTAEPAAEEPAAEEPAAEEPAPEELTADEGTAAAEEPATAPEVLPENPQTGELNLLFPAIALVLVCAGALVLLRKKARSHK
jgi:LPXTG-motif cell wall-anchored protein